MTFVRWAAVEELRVERNATPNHVEIRFPVLGCGEFSPVAKYRESCPGEARTRNPLCGSGLFTRPPFGATPALVGGEWFLFEL